jgi:hypothetical protein
LDRFGLRLKEPARIPIPVDFDDEFGMPGWDIGMDMVVVWYSPDCVISPGIQKTGTPKLNIINKSFLASDVPSMGGMKEYVCVALRSAAGFPTNLPGTGQVNL